MNVGEGGNNKDIRDTKTRVRVPPRDAGNKKYHSIENTNASADSNRHVHNQADNEVHSDVDINIIIDIKKKATANPTRETTRIM